MKLRQVALAASELEPVRSQLFQLLGLPGDFADPGVGEFGLVNSVMAIGDTYLEIVAPKQPNTAAGRLLERRGETCGYMVLMQVDSYPNFVDHLSSLNLRKIWEVDRAEVSACHVHPKDIGGAIVSFDEMRPPESWLWAGEEWDVRQARDAIRIVGCELQSVDAAALALRWGETMRVVPEPRGNGLRLAFADGTFIDFVRGETYEGICAFTFEVADSGALLERAAEMGLTVSADRDCVALGGLKLRFVTSAS